MMFQTFCNRWVRAGSSLCCVLPRPASGQCVGRVRGCGSWGSMARKHAFSNLLLVQGHHWHRYGGAGGEVKGTYNSCYLFTYFNENGYLVIIHPFSFKQCYIYIAGVIICICVESMNFVLVVMQIYLKFAETPGLHQRRGGGGIHK